MINHLQSFRLIGCHDSRASVDRIRRRLEQSNIQCLIEQVEITVNDQTATGYRLYVKQQSVEKALVVIDSTLNKFESKTYGSRAERSQNVSQEGSRQ
jgi:hypothetical protein